MEFLRLSRAARRLGIHAATLRLWADRLSPLRHCKSPDRPSAPGWKRARCPGCGWRGDRDQGAWMRREARRSPTAEMSVYVGPLQNGTARTLSIE